VRHSTIIIVSSKTIYNQFIKFYGKNFLHKVKILKFIPRPIHIKKNGGKIKKKLPRNFFYLPNQFWRHKNHFVVLRALNYLKKKNIEVFVVSTGHTYDRRWPNYFNSITNYILKNKLEDNFIILGNIEKKFVNYIYFLSLAVINPSLYEGLSTSVEEAKLLNKKIILSNIATHREQANSNCFFFNINDYKRLAKIMLLQLNKYKNKIYVNRSCQFDQKAFGNEFMRILNSVNKM
jgi:glycosyltransferase involved in cell wall biosynthesis